MSQISDTKPVEKAVPLRRNRDFMLLWSGAGLTLLGSKVTVFVYPLLALWATGSATAAGLVTSAALLPQLVVQLPAGVLVDRWDRRRFMIVCDSACVVLTASVAAAVFLGHVWIPHLVAVAFLQGAAAICYDLAERSAVRNMVPGSQLSTALSQNEARSRATGMLGQPIGSGLFSLVRFAPFLFTMLAHLGSLISLLMIRKPFQAERTGERKRFHVEVVEGLAWLWQQKLLRTAMILISVSNIVFSGLGLSVIFIIKTSGGSPALLGVITAVGGVGGMLGAMTATWWLRRLSMRVLFIGGFAAWALTVLPVAFVSNPLEIGLVFAVFGYIGGVFNVTGGMYLVSVVPDAMMGRAVSVVTLVGSGLTFLAGLAVGPALDAQGTLRTVLGLASVMGLLAIIAVLNPAVRGAKEVLARSMS